MKITFTHLIAGAIGLMLATTSAKAETIVIGHFGDPTPMNAARAEFEKATGWDIEWRKFAAGTDIIAAMASGDLLISELGSSPLAIAASQGVDLQLFMLSYAIGESESLVVRNDAGISAIEDIKGKRVAVPFGSTAHFSLMGALDHAGIDETEVTIMNMPPDQIAAAWEQAAIDAAFIWHPVQSKLLESGTRILGADKTAEWGFPTFNAWVVQTEFAAVHEEELIAFARTMDEANRAYLSDPSAWSPDSEPVKAVAAHTGAAPDQVPEILSGYTFIPLNDQLSATWLGNAADTIKATAEFLVKAGRIDTTAEDYSPFVNTAIAEAAAK